MVFTIAVPTSATASASTAPMATEANAAAATRMASGPPASGGSAVSRPGLRTTARCRAGVAADGRDGDDFGVDVEVMSFSLRRAHAERRCNGPARLQRVRDSAVEAGARFTSRLGISGNRALDVALGTSCVRHPLGGYPRVVLHLPRRRLSAERSRTRLWVWPAASAVAAFVGALLLVKIRPPGRSWISAVWRADVASSVSVLQAMRPLS